MKQLLLLCLFLSAAFAASAGEDYFSKIISLNAPAAEVGGYL